MEKYLAEQARSFDEVPTGLPRTAKYNSAKNVYKIDYIIEKYNFFEVIYLSLSIFVLSFLCMESMASLGKMKI